MTKAQEWQGNESNVVPGSKVSLPITAPRALVNDPFLSRGTLIGDWQDTFETGKWSRIRWTYPAKEDTDRDRPT